MPVLKHDYMWLHHPSVIVIYGGRGEGKSATAHYIMESRFHAKGVPCYIVAPPRVQGIIRTKGEGKNDWLTVIGKQMPSKSCILIDDAQLNLHAREHWKNVRLDKLISMSRHEKSTIIFNTQFSNRLDRNIVVATDTNIFKRPPLMGSTFERPGMKQFVGDIDDRFNDFEKELLKKSEDADMRQYSYVISNKPRYVGFVGPTPLCTYWSEDLSEW